jgi:hypothetical protein
MSMSPFEFKDIEKEAVLKEIKFPLQRFAFIL